jgi:hypothetical protein
MLKVEIISEPETTLPSSSDYEHEHEHEHEHRLRLSKEPKYTVPTSKMPEEPSKLRSKGFLGLMG